MSSASAGVSCYQAVISDEGNSALPATHTEGCVEANGGPAPRVGFICRCGATDHAVVTIDVCYDGYHRALFGVDAEGNVSLWAD